MKTTLVFDDTLLAKLRREAARQNRTMSDLVEAALRAYFQAETRRAPPPPLPSFRGGRTLVDIANRDALYDAMEKD